MGCSPSKGQLIAGIYNHQDKALQFGSYESNSHHLSGETELKSQTEKGVVSSGLILLPKENTAEPLQGKRTTVCDIVTGNADIIETNVSPEELLTEENPGRMNGRRMKNNECKSRHRERLRKTVYVQSKLDPPQSMVKAHQGVYDYLKHNIPKYESLLGLLEKATQTQLSLQTMVTILASHYEELNQALDEIATEGEQMLKMHGNHMVSMVVLPNPDIPEAEINSNSSDLLQHPLYHLIKKMRLIGDCVTGLGETSLEETGDYFGSLSQLLAGKLGEKRATELRLKQVLACVESYVSRKLSSEDSALPSEDSGIGVENESHNGSVRRCSHQESSGSGSSTRSSYDCPVQHYMEKDDDVDKDTDAEDSNDDEESKHEQRSKSDITNRNWSQADNSQYPLQVNLQYKMPNNSVFKWSDQKETNIIRPQTADDSSISCQRKHGHFHLWHTQRSRSADCLYRRVNDYMIQGHTRLSNDNQKPEWIQKRQNPSQFYCLQDGNVGSFKPRLTPSMTPTFEPVPPGKNAVRRLINTFSQRGFDNQNTLNGSTRFKRRKRSILPIISQKTDVSTNSNNNTSCYTLNHQLSERHVDVDVSSLPPPPPELLIDNSFEKNEVPAGDEEGNETQNQMCVTQRQKCCVSECPQVFMQRESSLPSRGSSAGGSLNISETCPNRQEFVDESDPEEDSDQPTGEKDKKDKATAFFQHSQKIIHLCHSTENLARFCPRDEGNIKSAYEVVGGTVKQEKRDSGKRETSTLYSNSHPPTTPPVSRARIPPSNYSTCHKVPRPTDLPPFPTGQVNDQQEISTASFTYQIQRSDRKNSDEGNDFIAPSSSVSFYAARSVFCQENQSASQSVKASCRSTLPRPWGEPKVPRGRLQATCLSQTITRPTYGPTCTDHQPLFCSVTDPHYQDSEVSTVNNGREEYTAETGQCSKQEIPVICSVSGSQEAEAKITDRRD